MSWVIRTILASPTAESETPKSAGGRPKNPDTVNFTGRASRGSSSDANKEAEDQPEGSDTINGTERAARYPLSDGDGKISPKGTRQATQEGSAHSERVFRQRKNLPRMNTAAVSNSSRQGQANLISMSSGVNIEDPAAPKLVLRATNPDPLSSHSQKANSNDRLSSVLSVKGEPLQREMSLTELYSPQHGHDPPGDFVEYMNQAEKEQMELMQKLLEMSKEAHEERNFHINDIHVRDLEIDTFRKQLRSMYYHDEDRKPAPNGGSSNARQARRNHDADFKIRDLEIASLREKLEPRTKLSSAREKQVRLQTIKHMARSSSELLIHIKQMTVEVILARVEVARIYRDWYTMNDLAVSAIAHSTNLKSKYSLGKGYLKRGMALYNIKVYWDATLAFESSKEYTEDPEERKVVEKWLEKAKEHHAAQSTTSTQPSPFTFGPPRSRNDSYPVPQSAQSTTSIQPSPFKFQPSASRTDSFPVQLAPGALKAELGFDSDFGSVRSFGSRLSSVASSDGTETGSPYERQSRNPERGPGIRGPGPRDRSPTKSASTEQAIRPPIYRPPTTPRESSPLVPRELPFKEKPILEFHKQRPTPTRTASTGTRWPAKPGLKAIGRTTSYQGGSGRTLDPSVKLKAPIVDRPRAATLRDTLLIRNAATAQSRRSSQIEYSDIAQANAGIKSPSGLAEIRKARHSLSDGSIGTAPGGATQDQSISKRSRIADRHTGDLDRLETPTDHLPKPNKENNITESESAKTTSPDDEFSFRGGDDRRKTYATLPIVDYEGGVEEVSESKDKAEGLGDHSGGPSDGAGSHERGSAESQERAQVVKKDDVRPLVKDADSNTEDNNRPSPETQVEEGGPDDLYGVEEGYLPPPSKETNEVSKEDDSATKGVPRAADASPQPFASLSMPEGMFDFQQGSNDSGKQVLASSEGGTFVFGGAKQPNKMKEESYQPASDHAQNSPKHDIFVFGKPTETGEAKEGSIERDSFVFGGSNEPVDVNEEQISDEAPTTPRRSMFIFNGVENDLNQAKEEPREQTFEQGANQPEQSSEQNEFVFNSVDKSIEGKDDPSFQEPDGAREDLQESPEENGPVSSGVEEPRSASEPDQPSSAVRSPMQDAEGSQKKGKNRRRKRARGGKH